MEQTSKFSIVVNNVVYSAALLNIGTPKIGIEVDIGKVSIWITASEDGSKVFIEREGKPIQEV